MIHKIKAWWQLLRIQQWLKNVFIIIGFVLAKEFSVINLVHLVFAFFAFCFISSAVYLLNDVVDVKYDQAHPRKKHRPIARGAILKQEALLIGFLFFMLAVIFALYVGPRALLIILIYFVINVFYSVKLKHIVIIDIFVISLGFLLRLLMGTFALGFFVSNWFLLCALMLTLFLGFAKRKAELLECGDAKEIHTRRVLEHYSNSMLDVFIAICASCTIVSYGAFTVLAVSEFNQQLFYTLPLVIYGLFRYIYLVYHQQKGQDTSADFFGDLHLILAGALWIFIVIMLNFI
jgi:4-hydroxybenzoate polyprenyltransferase